MFDCGLDPTDLHPLMMTLAVDLDTELRALESALSSPALSGQVLHGHLHAFKGMAGMFGAAPLLARIASADDACRQDDLEHGLPLARALLGDLHGWLVEVRAWLQRYS